MIVLVSPSVLFVCLQFESLFHVCFICLFAVGILISPSVLFVCLQLESLFHRLFFLSVCSWNPYFTVCFICLFAVGILISRLFFCLFAVGIHISPFYSTCLLGLFISPSVLFFRLQLAGIQDENDSLQGKHSKYAEQLQNEDINLPNNLDVSTVKYISVKLYN